MKVSIITSVYNNVSTIEEAIQSVLSQEYANIEFIVIDGGSTDGTQAVIERYRDQIDCYVSEPDRGIYDGLNKGIERATGDIVAFLHSDDLYTTTHAISDVVHAFETHPCDALYADLIYVQKHDINSVIRYWQSGSFERSKLKFGWMPPHPTFIIKRKLYEKHGLFDLNFKIAADYDFMLRILKQPALNVCYLPSTIYSMRLGGASNRSVRNILVKMGEDIHALRNNRVGGIYTIFMKNIIKLPQFIKKSEISNPRK